MNYAPLTVPKEMSAARTHRTFVTLGMRHLCVINNSNRVVGIITRKDLEHAAAHGSHEHPAHLQVSRSLIASTSRVYWRHHEEAGGQHRRVSSAAVRLPETLPIVEERSNEGGHNGSHSSEREGKKQAVEHVAHVSPVSGSPINTQPMPADMSAHESDSETELGPRQRGGPNGPDRRQ